jgi:hypothetical protein
LAAPEPRLHPVPTRPVFAPQVALQRHGEAEYAEDYDGQASVPSGRTFRYRSGSPNRGRLANAAEPVTLDLNPADRATRRRTLESLEPASKKRPAPRTAGR